MALFEPLAGRVVLVVGGSGGLGSATVDLLAGEGAGLVLAYRRNRQRAERFEHVARLEQADITVAADRKRLLDACAGVYGLAVFAGDPARVSDPSDLEESIRRSHEVNFLGPILLAREAAARMKVAGIAGSIVLLSSMQGVALFPNSTAYASSKASLVHAARILAKECRGPSGVRINVVAPGVNRAGMAEASIASGKYDQYLAGGTIGRFGRAEDVARAVRFFLEPDNYVTGQVLTVDGGLTL